MFSNMAVPFKPPSGQRSHQSSSIHSSIDGLFRQIYTSLKEWSGQRLKRKESRTSPRQVVNSYFSENLLFIGYNISIWEISYLIEYSLQYLRCYFLHYPERLKSLPCITTKIDSTWNSNPGLILESALFSLFPTHY